MSRITAKFTWLLGKEEPFGVPTRKGEILIWQKLKNDQKFEDVVS